MRRFARILGALMIAAGLGSLGWAATVWLWQDPFTAVVQKLEQRALSDAFDRRLEMPAGRQLAASEDTLPATAKQWRVASKSGDAVARLRIPAIGLNAIVVNGTDTQSLKRGPGRYLKSAMPGEGELVYIAGHRTTYGAPFSRIDRLAKGDRVFLDLPYARFEYEITGHRIVPATQLSVLESKGFEQLALQACHPRFFASHRYIAYAKPVAVTARTEAERTAEAAPAG
jgi:sortase A